MTRLILAGDVGGTRARFALFDVRGRRALHQEVLESRAFASFEDALARFLTGAREATRGKEIVGASFGIAGPVIDGRVKTTNLPWVIDAARVRARSKIPQVTLLNDLVAVGLGALAASPAKLRSLHLGNPRPEGGTVAVIAAGTGLGEATFVWSGSAHVACPTEGSHVDFAPRTPVEYALWRHLAREHGHVSYERVASGSTLATLYKFVRRHQRVPESKAAAASFASAVDPNLAVVDLALAGESEAAMRAVELWSSVYGAEAGNLVLKSMATSGLFVCGGVSARLATVLAEGLPGRSKGRRRAAEGSPFLRAFFDKGRMRPLLESVPVAVCTEPLAGLLGAAADAAQRAAIQSPARPRRPLGGGKARRSPSL